MALTSTASAPGKAILIGEHAVVYGTRSIAIAINLRCEVTLAAEDAADAERWVSACRQQTGRLLATEEVQNFLTPRIAQELQVNGFLEADQRATIIAPSELELGGQLGTGFFGAVYEG